MALFLFAGSFEAFTAAPRMALSVGATDYADFRGTATAYGTNSMGDNTPARRQQLSSANAAEATRDNSPKVGLAVGSEDYGDFRGVSAAYGTNSMGDNTPARRAKINGRAAAPQMSLAVGAQDYADFRGVTSPYGTNSMGDNTPARRQQLSSANAAEATAVTNPKVGLAVSSEDYGDFRGVTSPYGTNSMGDNTPARRQQLSSANAAEATRDNSPKVGLAVGSEDYADYRDIMPSAFAAGPTMGDNTPARRAMLNGR